MTEISVSRKPLELATLPAFYRNKPNDDDLYSFDSGLPASDRSAAHMLLLFAPWHDQYARRIDQRLVNPGYGERALTAHDKRSLRKLSDQIKCVSALAKLIEKGPAASTSSLADTITPHDLTEFVTENPYFFVTANAADQEKKDPRFVAKIEEINPIGYTYGSDEVSVEVVVSDVEGKVGTFPRDTKNWRLAHLATSHLFHLPDHFRYINNGYR